MSDTKDLKDLLERLKGEVGPLPPERPGELPEPGRPPRQAVPPARREGAPRNYRLQEVRPEPREEAAPAWSENKETMLFGMLAALIAALGGILAGLDYLVLIGAAVFALFSLVMALALLRSCLFSRRRAPESQVLAERVDALSRRVEMLSSRAASEGPGRYAPDAAAGQNRELEHKVEELRVLVKTLSKAMERGNK